MKKIKINKLTQLIILEAFSGLFGFAGVICGMMSIFALKDNIWGEVNILLSENFTIATVVLDTISAGLAIGAFYLSKYLINQKKLKNIEISKKEKLGNKLDFTSFVFGLIGLILSILSLLFLFPMMENQLGSEIATIVSIVFDTTSFVIVWFVIYITLTEVKHAKKKIKNK
ncbi:hypothetical protein [Mesoplasma photuris]|uniref:hypothetical protein n=1 Tax=Mesoplasma photuris TaxID=217731 RepID=UPI0004E2459E|nr:hypothetical protein [Mesoplasma photuris]